MSISNILRQLLILLGWARTPIQLSPLREALSFFSDIFVLAIPARGGLRFSFFLGIGDYFQSAERGKRSCVHSPALPRRIARRVAVVRRDRVVHPPRADRPPAEHGT